jgi:hypothetical protein
MTRDMTGQLDFDTNFCPNLAFQCPATDVSRRETVYISLCFRCFYIIFLPLRFILFC